jgi:hypothetical protein
MSPPAPGARGEITPAKLTGMFFSVAVLALGGLAVILGCMIPLLALGIDQKMLGILAMFGFMTVFGIAGLLVRQLSRVISMIQANPAQIVPQNASADYGQAQIPAPPRPVTSVTEHTTRNFEHMLNRERVTRE